ncbi:hypothetical protein ACVZMQ_005634, partial [Escherichia coli]
TLTVQPVQHNHRNYTYVLLPSVSPKTYFLLMTYPYYVFICILFVVIPSGYRVLPFEEIFDILYALKDRVLRRTR